MQSLKSLGSHRHLLGVVLAVNHASDTIAVSTGGQGQGRNLSGNSHNNSNSYSNSNNRGTESNGVDGLGDLRYRVMIFDHFSNSEQQASASTSASESTRSFMRLREGVDYSLLPLMALTTFTREWAALQCMRMQNLMLLAPYILKAAPVVSASRLE